MRRFALVTTSLLASFGLIASATAGRFSDVPDSHVHFGAIEHLAEMGVVTGNPDGTFAPGKTVNRAEFLIMLYRAKGVTPTATAVCLRDVIAGSWYLSVVCDAVGKGYVGGYSDGTFRPQNPVNRVEAVKMLLTVLEIPVGDFSEADRRAIAYPDVSLSAWYTKFLAAAFRAGILPVAGQSASSFGPESPLSRAEAAAYIDSALRMRVPAASSSSVVSQSTSMGVASSVATRSSVKQSSASSIDSRQVTFPVADSGLWPKAGPVLYRFTLTEKTIGEFVIAVQSQGRTAQCTLYRLDAEGLPLEYYPGGVDTDRCFLRVAMPAGNYQLELRGESLNPYVLSSRTVKGDASDGFTEAKTLVKQSTRLGTLDVDDHADYYVFKVTSPESLHIEVSNSESARCSVVPQNDVDLFGFASPVCNDVFAYPVGTYIVVIDRKPGQTWKQVSYGVVLKTTLK